MADRLKALWQKILDWWNQFTAKQKTLIVGAGSVILLTIIILVSVLNQPQYVLLVNANSTKEASEIKELLDSNSINYKMSDDGLEFKVLKKVLIMLLTAVFPPQNQINRKNTFYIWKAGWSRIS